MGTSKIKKTLKTLALALAALAPLLSSAHVFAASATESLVSVGSAAKGGFVTVTLKENSGAEPVNVATAVINYPADKLSFISVNSSSAFSIAASSSGGGGTVHIDRGALPAVSGSQTVASITFKALTDSGTAVLSIASGTVYSANSSSNIYAGGSGTSIALKPVPPPVVAPPPDTIPPKITAINVSQVTVTSALVSWTTSEPATSEVDYGPTQGYGLAAADGALVTDHKVTLNSPVIAPATLYHLIVKSADGAGNPASGTDTTFTTKGLSLIVTVKAKSSGKVVKGAEVSLLDQKAVTGADGRATLSNLPAGKISGAVKYKKNQAIISITMAGNDKSPPQTLSATISTAGGLSPLVYLAVLLVLLAAAGVYLGRRYPKAMPGAISSLKNKIRRSPQPPVAPPGPPSQPTIVIKPNSD